MGTTGERRAKRHRWRGSARGPRPYKRTYRGIQRHQPWERPIAPEGQARNVGTCPAGIPDTSLTCSLCGSAVERRWAARTVLGVAFWSERPRMRGGQTRQGADQVVDGMPRTSMCGDSPVVGPQMPVGQGQTQFNLYFRSREQGSNQPSARRGHRRRNRVAACEGGGRGWRIGGGGEEAGRYFALVYTTHAAHTAAHCRTAPRDVGRTNQPGPFPMPRAQSQKGTNRKEKKRRGGGKEPRDGDAGPGDGDMAETSRREAWEGLGGKSRAWLGRRTDSVGAWAVSVLLFLFLLAVWDSGPAALRRVWCRDAIHPVCSPGQVGGWVGDWAAGRGNE